MNTHTNISHTGGRDLQNTSSRADPSIREAAEQADQLISQEEAHPDIQGHLAEAPGGMMELDFLSIAQDPKQPIKKRIKAVKLIQDATQRDVAYLSIAQDSKGITYNRLKSAEAIEDAIQRDAAYLSITQDPRIDAYKRLEAANLIQDDTQRGAVYLSIAQDHNLSTVYRLEAAKLIIDQKIQEEFYPSMIENILSVNGFIFYYGIIAFLEEIPNSHIRDVAIKTICQNWPLAQEKQLQNHLAFRKLYALASNDALRIDLITTIVVRTDLDAGFRKSVVEEHVKDTEEQERLLKVIEEKQEGSLNAPRTKKAR